MFERPRVSRDRRGRFVMDLPPPERDVLRQLPDQLRRELEDVDDPGTRRVFPPASNDDDELDREYRQLVGGELLAGRQRAIDVMEASIEERHLDEEQVLAWLSTVNDLRLILGTRLGVTDERQDEDVPGDDPRAQAYALYHYLGFLEEQIVQALSGALPSDG